MNSRKKSHSAPVFPPGNPHGFNCGFGFVVVDGDGSDLQHGAILTGPPHAGVDLVRDRMLQPADVAGTVLFLASPLSDLVQGQVIIVDGGISIRV